MFGVYGVQAFLYCLELKPDHDFAKEQLNLAMSSGGEKPASAESAAAAEPAPPPAEKPAGEEPAAKAKFCSECGAKQKPGAKFCADCGSKM